MENGGVNFFSHCHATKNPLSPRLDQKPTVVFWSNDSGLLVQSQNDSGPWVAFQLPFGSILILFRLHSSWPTTVAFWSNNVTTLVVRNGRIPDSTFFQL